MNILSKKVNEMVLAFEPLDQNLIDMKLELASAKAKMDSSKKLLSEADTKIQEMGRAISNARLAHESCLQINAVDHPACLELKSTLDRVKNEGAEFYRGEYTRIQSLAFNTAEKHDLLLARFTTFRDRYKEAISP